jgi:hypothetical protein
MDERPRTLCIAFAGTRRIAAGELAQVALNQGGHRSRRQAPILLFDDATSEPIELDFRGTPDDVLKRLARRNARRRRPPPRLYRRRSATRPRPPEARRRRPRGHPVAAPLGVAERPARRRARRPAQLVEPARRDNDGRDRRRRAQESAYRFISVMAGDRPGFEEAARALFAGDRARFDRLVKPWPADIRNHARKLAAAALESRADSDGAPSHRARAPPNSDLTPP